MEKYQLLKNNTFSGKSKQVRYSDVTEVRKALREFGLYICFLFVAVIVALSSRHSYMYYYNKTIHKSFLERHETANDFIISFNDICRLSDWYYFLENHFLETFYDGIPRVFMRKNMLLGPPRLRQIRVNPEECYTYSEIRRHFQVCYPKYSERFEETTDNYKGSKYFTLSDLSATSIEGKLATYVGAGYVENLSYDKEETEEIIKHLRHNNWVDRGTRIVILEFCLFNEDTELYETVKFLGEVPPTGGIISSAQLRSIKLGGLWLSGDYFAIICAIIFYVLTVKYTMEEVKEIRKNGFWTYLCVLWNFIDITVLVISIISFIYNIYHPIYGIYLLQVSKDPDVYVNLDRISYWNVIYNDLIAICAFLLFMKIFKYISFNKTLLQLSQTLNRCYNDLLGFGVMFFIILMAYAMCGFILFSQHVVEFSTLLNTLSTLMSIMMGTFDYANLEYGSPTLGPIFFISYIALVYFILMNMFLAIIFDTYNTIKNDIKSGPKELNTYLSNAIKKLKQRMLTNRKRQQELTTVSNEPTEAVAEPKPISMDPNTSHQPVNEPWNMTESFVVREYFENYIRDEERRKITNLADHIDLLEDVIKKLSVDVEDLLKKIKSKQRPRA